jgi:hypothetical protein
MGDEGLLPIYSNTAFTAEQTLPNLRRQSNVVPPVCPGRPFSTPAWRGGSVCRSEPCSQASGETAWVVGPAAAPCTPLRVFGMILPEKGKIRGRDHSAQLVELCFLSVVERFTSGGESSCRRRQLSSKISGLSGLLSISSTLSLVAGGATDAHTPTPPAACDRNALSAL